MLTRLTSIAKSVSKRLVGTGFDKVPINAGIVYPVDNVAQLRLTEPVANNQQAETGGYSVYGSAAGKYYSILNDSGIDNGGSKLKTALGHSWNLIADDRVSVKVFGAVEDQDVSQIILAMINSGLTKILCDGNYLYTSGVYTVEVDTDIEFDGVITPEGNGNLCWFQNNAKHVLTDYVSLPEYKENSFTLADASVVNVGDYVVISSAEVATSDGNVYRSLGIIADISGNVVTIDNASKFNWSTISSPSILVFSPVTFKLKNLSIDTKNSTNDRSMRFDGYQILSENYTVFSSNAVALAERSPSYITFFFCYNSVFNTNNFSNVTYSALLGSCYNTVSRDTTCVDVWHGFVMQSLTDTFWGYNTRGTGGIIESHAAFNINYDGFDSFVYEEQLTSTHYCNLRSIGGSLKNGVATSRGTIPDAPKIQSTVLLGQPQAAVDATFIMENVDWYLGDTNGSAGSAETGNVTYTNVKAGGDIVFNARTNSATGNVTLNNVSSEIGLIAARGNGVSVKNSQSELDAVISGTDIYDIKPSSIGATYSAYRATKVNGSIFKAGAVNAPLTDKDFNIRVFPVMKFNDAIRHVDFTIKLLTRSVSTSAGGGDYTEKTYYFDAKLFGGKSATIITTPIEDTGSLDITTNDMVVTAGTAVLNTASSNNLQWYIELPFNIATGGSNGQVSCISYELSMTERYNP
jgi:hypothetical protein